MVKSNFSLGGKLLTIFLTLVIFIGAIAGTIVVVYKTVKVRTIAGWLPGDTEWISESYDGTISEFVQKVSEALSGDITLDTLREISPALAEKMDAVVDNVENVGLFKLDRGELYSTPVDQLTSNVSSVLVITGTLADLSEQFSFDLPDMDLIHGAPDGEEPLWIDTQVNDNEAGTVDKAFSMSDTAYTYYTRTETFADTFTRTDETGAETERAIVTWEERKLYSLDGVAKGSGGYLTVNGEALYLQRTAVSADGTSVTTYARITENNDAVYAAGSSESAEQYTFALEQDEKTTETLCVWSAETGGYVSAGAAEEQKSVYSPEIAAQYRYRPLYVQRDAKPESGEYYQSDGKYYLLATLTDAETGNYIVDEENGGYAIADEYGDETLYSLEYEYAEAPVSAASAQTALYVRTNGIASLPLTYAMDALSASLNTQTLTLDGVGRYFGIAMDSGLLETVLYVPLEYLSDAMTPEMQALHLDDVLDLNANSSRLLLYLAYGTEGQDYTVAADGVTIEPINRRTIGEISGRMDCIKISDAVDLGENPHKLMEAIADWSLNDFSDADKVDSLTLGQILTIVTDEEAAANGTEASPKILQALADVSLGEVGEVIDDIPIGDLLEEDGTEANPLLDNLRNSTLQTLAADLRDLSVQAVFADDIYTRFAVGNAAQYEGTNGLLALYGANNLFVYDRGNYETYDPDVHGSDSSLTLYSHYKLLEEAELTLYKSAGVPLYVLRESETEAGSYVFVLATGATARKLPAYDAEDANSVDYSKVQLYTRSSGADGEYVYAEIDYRETYPADIETLYYQPSPGTYRAVELETASYGVLPEYESEDLYTRLAYVGEYTSDGFTSDYGNLYYFDAEKETWTAVALDSAAQDGKIVYTVAQSLPAGTKLFTYGTVRGVWKYLITADGAEQSCKMQNIDELVSNVRANMNSMTLGNLYADGMIDITPPDGSGVTAEEMLATPVSASDPSKTLGSLTLNDLITEIYNLITRPSGGN